MKPAQFPLLLASALSLSLVSSGTAVFAAAPAIVPSPPLCQSFFHRDPCSKGDRWARSAEPGERIYRVRWFGELDWVSGLLELRVSRDGAGRLATARGAARLTPAEVGAFERAFQASGFASLTTGDPPQLGSCVDGTDLEVEAVVDGAYHDVERNCQARALWPMAQILMDLARTKQLDTRSG